MREVGYRVSLALDDTATGDPLMALLWAVARCGSIHGAAAELRLSYRHAWGLLRKAEARLGYALLEKRVGGEGGGGAELTAPARALLARFRQVQAAVRQLESPPAIGSPRPLLLASTIGPIESGVLPALVEGFHRQTGILVRHIAAGSGQALDIARDGCADLVLTHAPGLEEEFVAAGFGTGRHPLMHNDFLLAGSAADPAGVSAATTAVEACRRIAAVAAPFVSRGDRSGTHLREMALWQAAAVTPGAPWHHIYERGAMGSAGTLRYAAALPAYTLVDRATWLSVGAQGLAALLAGDPALRNEFALIPVSSGRFPQVLGEAARRFVHWATGPEGQELIRRFGADHYGVPLFFPAA